jgi:predicted membrane protein
VGLIFDEEGFMRNRISAIVWGVAFICAAVIIGGNALGAWNWSLFFPGWWTLFIIVPSLVGVIRSGLRSGATILLLVGVFLLLGAQKAISHQLLWSLFLPILLALIGLMILLGAFGRGYRPKNETGGMKDGKTPGYTAVFSGQDVRITDEFFGANLTAVFGGVDLDLREAVIKQDVVINGMVVFGGVDIKIPSNVKVKISTIPVFGGASCKAQQSLAEDAPVIYFNCTVIFGGAEIK